MAVWRMTDRKRKLPWRAKVKGKVKDFLTKQDAEFWERSQLQSYTLTGLPLTIEALQKVTVGEIIEKYLQEKTPLKGSANSEEYFLKKFLRDEPMCKLSLASVRKSDAYSYKDKRLKDSWKGKPISRGSVKRQVGILHNVFSVAREEWGYDNLSNPFDGMKLRDGHARERLVTRDELGRIEEATKQCRRANKTYVKLAVYLAIETAMRLQEIFNLTWDDIDIDNRRIKITKSKTDNTSEVKGRTIVMSAKANLLLAELKVNLLKRFGRKLTRQRIFPMNGGAFKQTWRKVLKRAKIEDLHFRDLRHTAATWFDQAGLTNAEHGLMMGHGKRTMRDRYVHPMLQSIQDKLDRYQLGGRTEDEIRNSPMPEDEKAIFDRSYQLWNAAQNTDTPIGIAEATRKAMQELSEDVPKSNNVIDLKKRTAKK